MTAEEWKAEVERRDEIIEGDKAIARFRALSTEDQLRLRRANQIEKGERGNA